MLQLTPRPAAHPLFATKSDSWQGPAIFSTTDIASRMSGTQCSLNLTYLSNFSGKAHVWQLVSSREEQVILILPRYFTIPALCCPGKPAS